MGTTLAGCDLADDSSSPKMELAPEAVDREYSTADDRLQAERSDVDPSDDDDDDDDDDDASDGGGPDTSLSAVRIDKWLWAARMFKTRSLASRACEAGHVKLNGSSTKAAKLVRPSDRVEVVTPGGRKILEIVALAEKRGPASVAQKLYLDHSPPPPPKEMATPDGRRERGTGRPTKRERRLLDRLKS